MKKIQKLTFVLGLAIVCQMSAQEQAITMSKDNPTIENFQLPSFTELSNHIATEYTTTHERLPNLANIGEHIQKSIRQNRFDENSISATFRNLTSEHSILPNISSQRFQLRNSLNNIMFNGFDINQLHLNEAYRGQF